ncbi:MAG: hypothetical protein HZA53_10910, partial [Planctomycetes bacterium]|nr:hypothetical protein [Planctomycetota bacterium]
MKSRALHVDFLLQARKLAARERGSPTQGGLRRATSTAYFALFHFLVDEAARAHMGSHRARSSARGLLARAFQHTTMVQASKAFSSSPMHPRLQAALGTPVPMELLREVAATFCDLQRARHTADYDPLARFAAD